jgi:MraZ protein
LFLGTYEHTIDEKGRVIIPSKYREEIGESKLIVTRGLDDNLVVYTEEGFHTFAERWMEQLSAGRSDFRKLRRYVAVNAETCDLDKQGRILLPAKLREHAHLTRDVVISGNLSTFEIWDPQRFAEASDFGDEGDISKQIEMLDIRI